MDNTFNFANLCEQWLKAKKLYVKESTYNQYYNILNKHILPLSDSNYSYPISVITIQDYLYSLLKKGYSEKTLRDILSVIKDLFGYLESIGTEIEKPVLRLCIKSRSPKTTCLDESSQKTLCNYILANLNNKSLGILIALYTGIRLGELCALQWNDIDFSTNTLTISKTLIRVQNKTDITNFPKTKIIITKPKSDKSCREIPMPEFLSKIAFDFVSKNSDYVLSGNSKPIEPRNMQYFFHSITKENDISNISFHMLRHTFATRCVEKNFDIKTLSEILGHSSVKITLDRYVHSNMELKRKNMNKLEFFI